MQQTIQHSLKISAVIPAAGLSSRMHKYKPLLKLGNQTIVEHSIQILKKCNINDIIVVTGHNRKKIEPVILKTCAKAVFNPEFKTGMLGSIKTGIKAVLPQSHGFFLLPVDIPVIRTSTIETLISMFNKNREHIIIPHFNGEAGHPPVIPAWLIPQILNLKENSNLGSLLLSRKKDIKKQTVHDQGILMDADTQKAYELLKERHFAIDIPNKEECQSMIHINLKEEKSIQSHIKLVAQTAMKIVRAVQEKQTREENQNPTLDMNLVYAGALLHDIRRKEANHAATGARYLLSLGFPKVANIVTQHMDLTEPLADHLTEAQIVYFADKLCKGDNIESNFDYSSRFKEKIRVTPHAKTKIVKRYEHTKRIQARIEKISGRSVKSILQK
jgi:molybdenum cofactor cytidylyltransferase